MILSYSVKVFSIFKISKMLYQNKSTVSRELKKCFRGQYSPLKAQTAYFKKRHHCERKKSYDSEMLISLSEVFETPVSILLGEDIVETEANDLKVISEKLEVLNLQLSKQKESKKNILRYLFILILVISFIILFTLFTINSPYLNWNYTHPETAFMGISFHIFELAFIRLAPILIVGAALGIYLMRRNKLR